jgi:hypothetical protein
LRTNDEHEGGGALAEAIIARFKLHVRCENCLKEGVQTLDVPDVVGAPTTVNELLESGLLAHQNFVCRGCDGNIARLVSIKTFRPAESTGTKRMSNPASVTIHVALCFRRNADGELEADQPLQTPSAEAAKRRAQRYAEAGGGGVAFSRTGDPQLGDWRDAVMLGVYGEVPEDVMDDVRNAA